MPLISFFLTDFFVNQYLWNIQILSLALPEKSILLVFSGSFSLQVTRQSPNSYVVIMNGSCVEVDVHRLSDGGLLLSYDGSSYTTYMKEEVDRWVAVQGPFVELFFLLVTSSWDFSRPFWYTQLKTMNVHAFNKNFKKAELFIDKACLRPGAVACAYSSSYWEVWRSGIAWAQEFRACLDNMIRPCLLRLDRREKKIEDMSPNHSNVGRQWKSSFLYKELLTVSCSSL